jgi:hypothetical protein
VKLFRCIGAAALVAGVLLTFPGAHRALAAAPTVSIDSPGTDKVETPFAIAGSAHQDGNEATINSIKIELIDDDDWSPTVTQNYTAGGSNSSIFSGSGDTVSFNWGGIGSAIARYNGPYTVAVTVVGSYRQPLGGTQSQSNKVSKSFRVEIPPATPSGVSASMPADSTVATVKWNKNPEVDIAGYAIVRSYAGASGKTIAGVDATKTSYTDDLAGQAPGQYKYAVIAVRHARSCKSGSNVDEACSRTVPGKASAYSAPVTVRGQTTTTTTIKKSGGGGSTGGGGSNGGGGGGSGGGTTTTLRNNSGASSGGARSGATGGFAPGGDVDLSKFGSLLNPGARSGSGSSRVTEPDGTFDETLPYGERPVAKPKDDNSLITIGGASLPKPSDDWVKFIGLGSFVTALLVHVLWFKQQVDRLPLEALE